MRLIIFGLLSVLAIFATNLAEASPTGDLSAQLRGEYGVAHLKIPIFWSRIPQPVVKLHTVGEKKIEQNPIYGVKLH